MNKNFWDIISKTNATVGLENEFGLFDGPISEIDNNELQSIEITITKNLLSPKPAWLLLLEVKLPFFNLNVILCLDVGRKNLFKTSFPKSSKKIVLKQI